jgi:hypothetical protein
LVNNAGAGCWLSIADTSSEEATQMMAVTPPLLPKRARDIRPLTPTQAASTIVTAIEKDQRIVVKPDIFRLFFLLNTLFPTQTEAMMCH